jgi:DNA repair protein RadA
MGHASTCRILLRKVGKTCIAIMIDSPYHAYDQTKFMIAEGGMLRNTVKDRNGEG